MGIIREVTSFEDIKVEIVSSFPDLQVYKTNFRSSAEGKDHVWYIDNSFGDIKVKYVTSFPDLKVEFVNSESFAGWKNTSHELVGQLG